MAEAGAPGFERADPAYEAVIHSDFMPPIEVPQGYIPQTATWRPLRLDMRDHPRPGRLVVFDGIDGAGKSSLISRLGSYLSDRGQQHIVVKTPTDDVRDSWVWRAFFHPDHVEDRHLVDVYAMTMVTLGDRLIFQRKVVDPALAAGQWVICDRYVLSSAAFHADIVHQLLTRALFQPDLSVVVDVSPQEAVRRIRGRDYESLHPEDPERFETARSRLLDLAAVNQYTVIDTTNSSVDESFASLQAEADKLLG
jgi:dTMP kinase